MKHFDTMFENARAIMARAYTPYAKFPVGACLRTENNQFFSGCNMEISSYSLSICAESNAIVHMVAAGERKISEILVITTGKIISPPCGGCRQRLSEFATDDCMVHICDEDRNCKSKLLSELFPEPFGPKHLE